MGYEYSFFDNQLIGVDELNKITSRLLTEGVARTPSSVSDLNDFVADIATQGVVPETTESLKVSVADTTITINKGVGIFKDGTTIEITEKELFPRLTGHKQYVYLVSDLTSNSAYPCVLEEVAKFEQSILLATIDENGILTDERKYARGKLAYYASADVNNNVYIEADNINTTYSKDEEGYITYRVNINPDMYKCVQIHDKNGINFARYNFTDDTFFSYGHGMASYYTYDIKDMAVASLYKRRWLCLIEKGNGFIDFKFKSERRGDEIPLSLKLEFIA